MPKGMASSPSTVTLFFPLITQLCVTNKPVIASGSSAPRHVTSRRRGFEIRPGTQLRCHASHLQDLSCPPTSPARRESLYKSHRTRVIRSDDSQRDVPERDFTTAVNDPKSPEGESVSQQNDETSNQNREPLPQTAAVHKPT